MKKNILGLIVLMALMSASAIAQDGYAERVKKYIQDYAAYAMEDQRKSGVPAAITLGQGILETEAGNSRLATEANNHFGIKCNSGWDGPSIKHTDDAKNECFKKYESALESYNDHSAHLHRNPRYHRLFAYSITDYARWAHGLRSCGYATNPKYGPQLVKIIEDFKLQEFTYAALDSNYDYAPDTEDVLAAVKAPAAPAVDEEVALVASRETPEESSVAISNKQTKKERLKKQTTKSGIVAVTTPADVVTADVSNIDTAVNGSGSASYSQYPTETPIEEDGKIVLVNGIKAVKAKKDDVLLPYAMKYKMRYAHLLEINDLPDEPLKFDTYIYLEKKNVEGVRSEHTVLEGESLIQIAQEEGIQLKKLAALNLLNQFEQPVKGTILNLQTQAAVKPEIVDYTMPNSLPAAGVDIPEENITPTVITEVKETPKYAYADVKAKPENSTVKEPVRPTDAYKSDPQQPQLQKPKTEPLYESGSKKYLVKRGDTAYSIAKRNGITVGELLDWNQIEAQDLKAGQTIIVKK